MQSVGHYREHLPEILGLMMARGGHFNLPLMTARRENL
jgi:hypothetical protein